MSEPLQCLCAEDIVESAVYPCKHIICTNCCLRFRVLMDDFTCPYCRDVQVDQVHVVRNPEVKPSRAQIPMRGKFGILCETEEMKKRFEKRLDSSCPICKIPQFSQKNLKTHFHDKHPSKTICRVCMKHEYVFTDELEVYTHKELNTHMNNEHATCPFCDWHFYSNKELDKHCKTQHECCFICERINPGRPQYFPNYAKLKDHFLSEHYMCMVPSCLEDKFIVFGSKIELQGHMLEQHKSVVNVKEMQQVNLDDLQDIQSRSQSPYGDSDKAQVQRRYTERLRINAKNDNGLIDQIMQANHTFETKKVPVDVFIKTYGSVLPNSSSDEITLLLEEFSKMTTNLATDKRTQLNNALVHRRPKSSQLSYEDSVGPNGRKSSSASSSSSSLASSSGPAQVARASPGFGQWAGRRAANAPQGLANANLPRLGDGLPGARPSFMNTPPRIPLNRPAAKAKPSLPSLPKQSGWGNGPQTRLPALGAPRSTRPHWLEQDRNSPSPGPSSSSSLSNSSSANSSSTSLNRAATPNFSGLPSLPQQQQKKTNGKRKKVVRIV